MVLIGKEMMDLMNKVFPICRSITGDGVRTTLNIIKSYIPINIFEVPSGTKVFDWVVPLEWNIRDAYVLDINNNHRVIDFNKNNLHIISYSIPVDKTMGLKELDEHLYSLPNQPDAIPYVTSYYKERWGFCISHNHRKQLKNTKYRVVVDSELKKGFLTYGEIIIKGETDKEVFLSTYICHPSIANELSGMVVLTFLVKWIMSKPRRFTYRIVFIPETIGSIVYINKNLNVLKKNMIVGFVINFVGDNQRFSYLASRDGDTFADKIVLNVLSFKPDGYDKYSFLSRGSDERQYDAPGVDLPVCSVMRNKYSEYPEYHTSLDNMGFINVEGLNGSFELLKECITLIENNRFYKIRCLCEPQLGKRGLYPTIGTKDYTEDMQILLNFICYADGTNDLVDISNKIGVSALKLYPVIKKLLNNNLLEELPGYVG